MKKKFVEFVSNTPFSSWLFQGTRHITNPVKRQRLDQGMSLGLDKLKRGSGFGYGDYNSGKRGFDGGTFDQGFGGFSVMKRGRNGGFGYGDYNFGKRGFDGRAFDQGFGRFSVMK